MKNSEIKTAAAYIRVSTDNQTELSPDSQIKIVKQYAKQHGYLIPKEFVFRDDGISGRHADKRPQFNKMIAVAKQKPSPFCVVLLWKFSRFARNQEESIFYKSMLRKNNVEVISVSEPVIDGPFGSLIERIIEWSDEYYSIRLSGEVKRGMTEKVSRGGAVCVPAFGYKIIDKKYVIDEETSPLIKKIFNDYLNGVGSSTIARNLNLMGIKTTRGNKWENRTVDYILQNPVYIGKIRWNPKRKTIRNYKDPDIMIVNGQHEPIIDENTFDKVQTIIEHNRKVSAKYVHSNISEEYMLHGLVKCSDCGANLTMSAKGKGLQCSNYIHGKCQTSHYISLKKINELVLTGIEQAFKEGNFNIVVKHQSNLPNEPELDIDALISKEEIKLNRVKEAYIDGIYTIDDLKEYKSLIGERILVLKSKQKSPQHDKNTLRNKIINENKNILNQLRNGTTSEHDKNEILKSFVDKVVFNRKTSSIELFYYA